MRSMRPAIHVPRWAAATIVAFAAGSAAGQSPPFEDVAARARIDFVHFNGMSGETAQAMFIAVRDGRQDLIESLQADLEGYRRERLPARPWRRDHPLSSPPRLNLDQRQ